MGNKVLGEYLNYMEEAFANAQKDYLRKISKIRVKEIQVECIPDMPVEEDFTIREESLNDISEDRALTAAFRKLNRNEFAVLFQLFCMERSMEAIARELHMDYTSVSRIKQRALQKLRKELVGGVYDV